ncbi:hypothetical protein GOV03_02075 [Candidatus Woesearchaeota archaeon]|nr:hypothetical protein [Candidatus Woesearchaeota archaeon]
MAKTKKVSKIKIKKKRWFPIFAPKFLGRKEIGESYLTGPEVAKGRTVKISLRELTKNIRDQNISVSLRINEISGSNLQTEVVAYAYMPFFVRKLIRTGTGKIDDSFILQTKDGKNVRFKPLAITVFKVNKSIKTSIRKRLKELLAEELSKSTFDTIVVDLLRYKLQMDLKKKLNKICPVREVIMRVMKLEEGNRVKAEKVEFKKEVPKSEVKVEKTEEKKEAPVEAKPSSEVKEEKKEVPKPSPAPKEEKPLSEPKK